MKMRPSKSKIFLWNFIPITHSIIYHYQKAKKGSFAAQKSLRVLKLMWIFIDRVVWRYHSDSVRFRFFSDRILSRVLSDRVLFESSVIVFFRVRSNKFFSWAISALFPPCRYSFIKLRCYYFFLSKTSFVLHSLYSQKQ